ncbi:MAG: DUF3604 domain-containing protein [Victivallaceae bacterium]|nr:DUF3604 domain-containing protein [Victivallaceae bacterium]
MQIYWGDIHNHNEIGYGKGSLERSFDIAENSLDFYAFTPHTWWPDLPDNDEAVKQHHLNGFKKVRKNWELIKQTVQERYSEGKFVTLLAWEWHSLAWGDYCIYFPVDNDEFYYAANLDELKAYAREHKAFILPHHVAYRKGWRGVDWNGFDETSSPVVEIFSEHGNSFESDTHCGMYSHSMGGVDTTQTALHNLKQGRHFGFIACTDDHYGYPGGSGHGITAILAGKLDRKSIFNAIKQRHTYATTGDRIKLDFKLNEGIMGDTVTASESAAMSFAVEAKDRIKTVEIYKNGELFKLYSSLDFMSQHKTGTTHLVKLEWGWDMIASKGITKWQIELRSSNGILDEVTPAFCGGSGSVTELNLIHKLADNIYGFDTFTSRKNAKPVNAVSFIFDGALDCKIELAINGIYEGAEFSKQLKVTKAELIGKDSYVAAVDKFSSPKLKVHALIEEHEYCFSESLIDDKVESGDFYFLKVIQHNGQMAWSSPIWLGGGKLEARS